MAARLHLKTTTTTTSSLAVMATIADYLRLLNATVIWFRNN
jgi:hypothetical protein